MKPGRETVRHGEMLKALNAMVSLFEEGLAVAKFPPNSRGGKAVADTVSRTRVLLEATNLYRGRGRRDG